MSGIEWDIIDDPDTGEPVLFLDTGDETYSVTFKELQQMYFSLEEVVHGNG